MADIKTKVLEIDTGGAITNIKEFKEHIEDLKGKLLGLEKGTEEYNEVAKELRSSQEKLNEVMDVAKGRGEAVAGSYDNLVATMRELKKAWRATGDETERANLGEQILNINNQLKELDASTGNFQRNVGDYANAFTKAFENVTAGISSSIPAVGKLSTAFKGLLANPVVAFFAAISAAIMAVVNSMKNSESQMNRFKVATAGVKVVVDGLKNVLSKVSEAVVTLTEKISQLIVKSITKLKTVFEKFGWDKWAGKMGDILEKIEDYTELEKKEVDLLEKRRKIAVEIAKTDNQISELRSKIDDKEKYSEQERLKFIDEWEKAEKRRAQLAVDLAREEYNAIKKRNSLTESGTKDLDAENDALVALINAQGNYSDALIRVNKQKSSLLSQISAQAKQEAKEAKQQMKDDIKELVSDTKNAVQEIQTIFESKKIKLDFEFDLANLKDTKNAEGGLKALFKDFNAFNDIFTTKDIDIALQRTIDYNNQVLQLTKEKNEAIIAENQKLLDALPDSPDAAEKRVEAEKAISDAKINIQNAETENILSNLEAQDNAEQKLSERRNQRTKLFTDGLQSVANMINMVAQYQHQQIQQDYKDGKISEATAKKRFEDTKKMQIASAVINMAAGVVTAISQAQQLGPIAGPIAAAVNAAAVITAGAIQIAQISKTKFGDGTANTTTPNVAEITNEYTPQYTQNITADTELSELSNAINSRPAYVSVTDINEVQNKVKVTEQETSF